MANDVSRRGVLGGAAALGTIGLGGGLAEAQGARTPLKVAVQDNQASTK